MMELKKYPDVFPVDIAWAGKLIAEENRRQFSKWGLQRVTLFEWLNYTTEELGELAKAIADHQYRNVSKDEIILEAIQTATLCIKIAQLAHLYGDILQKGGGEK